MTNDPKNPQILISDRDSGLPYSKGLMASQVMVTGLSPVRAYQVAEAIEERLRERGVPSISNEELGELALAVLEDLAGERYARNFQRWREIEALQVPLVVLIGGATGVGKSTLATQLATRLGIVRVVATDAIREVMRALFSHELMPTLHASSFEAGSVLREPPSKDEVVVGFREQTAAVAVGVQALVERAAMEGTHLIIEGAHVVPGFLDLEPWRERILAVPVVVTIEEDEVHRSHFAARASEHTGRPAERYLDRFDDIRRVQRYIKSQALSHGVPVIANYSFDRALAAIIDLVMERATERTASARVPAGAASGRAPAPGGGERRRQNVKLFLDTANIEEIREINRWGVLGGVTTNPSLVAKEADDPERVWKEILTEVEGPISLETTELEPEAMYQQGLDLAQMAPNAVVKVPMTPEGLGVGKRLTDEGIKINVTLVFSPAQAILAAEIGAYIVSPFLGRLDDVASDGMDALRKICDIYEIQGYDTLVLAASLRHPMHIVESALAGADIATMPFAVFKQLVKHPLTDAGLEKFLGDWKALKQELEKGA